VLIGYDIVPFKPDSDFLTITDFLINLLSLFQELQSRLLVVEQLNQVLGVKVIRLDITDGLYSTPHCIDLDLQRKDDVGQVV
jgi:hypothetical protein